MPSIQGLAVPHAEAPFLPIEGSQSPELPAVAPPVDAHHLLQLVLHQLQRQIDAKRLGVNLQLVARGYLIRGDRDRMQQTYANLISNAITRARKGGQLTVKSTCPDPDALRVQVTQQRGSR